MSLKDRQRMEAAKYGLDEAGSDVWDMYETLLEYMGAETLLSELMQAMSSQEARENLEHIAQMHDIRV